MSPPPIPGLQSGGRRVLSELDALFNRVYGWRWNPLYHSGALVVACFWVLLVTGLYLLVFYRIGAPYASMERIVGQAFAGRWIRSLHRYASDLAILAAAVHALRMFVQDRAWGPRALAWISGVVLLGVFFLCGWTGYVMVWDTHAQVLAIEGARLLDALPIFSEPLGRTFVGEGEMPEAFFFLNLFAHIATPVGILLVLWIHVSRLARTYLMPPRGIFWGMLLGTTALSVAWSAPLGPRADLLGVPGSVDLDLFYSFWLPLTRALSPGAVWLGLAVATTLAFAVPRLTRPKREDTPAPSYVHPRFCTGCEQCYQDCPYEAISMVPRDDDRPYAVGWVDEAKCVSCGICAGSCAPMGVGPEGRTGRDQLVEVRAFLDRETPSSDAVVVVGCARSAAGWGRSGPAGAPMLEVSCAGSMHTSVVEYVLRFGAGGVMVVSCPPRDCWNREGVTWLEERLYNQREAELKDRVDRRRLRVVHFAERETSALEASVELFRKQIRGLERALGERRIDIDTTCDVPEVSALESRA